MPASEGRTNPRRTDPPRRAVIAAVPAVLAAAAALDGCTSSPKPQPRTYRFFTGHQAAVVEAATARIAPGPADDPAEAGHPGAREAGVTGYIDTMLAALGHGEGQAPHIFAGGPWSNRHTSGPDLMARFVQILAAKAVSQFTALLFEHTIEGLYASPEYGGNRGLAGWKDIAFPGDIQPRGYTPDEVERSDGHDPVQDTGIVADVLKLLGAL